ncbi:MAG: Gfo/Idh/MocA family oxidoreductase, partial [Sphaerochaetaceae bacterium]|nr:Gfo/Idh/MocA family oxidoreductase [Sphaerochaetaceae bacterium]
KSIIDSKEYGEIVSAMILVAWDRQGDYYSKSPWRGKYEGEGAGCIINQAIHTIDLLDYLCCGVKIVNGFTARLRNTNDYEVEDTSMARFILKNGAQAVGFMTNSYPMSKICQLEVHFEKATMLLDQTRVFIKTSDGQEKDQRFEAAQGYKSEWGLSHGKLIGLFYDSLETGKPFICDAKTGVQTIRIVNALQHSNGHEITIA